MEDSLFKIVAVWSLLSETLMPALTASQGGVLEGMAVLYLSSSLTMCLFCFPKFQVFVLGHHSASSWREHLCTEIELTL